MPLHLFNCVKHNSSGPVSKRNSSVSCDLLFKEEQKSWSTTTPEVDDLQRALRGPFAFLSLFVISPFPSHDGALHRRGLAKGRCSLDILSFLSLSSSFLSLFLNFQRLVPLFSLSLLLVLEPLSFVVFFYSFRFVCVLSLLRLQVTSVRVSDFVCSVKFHVPFSYLSVPLFVFDMCSLGVRYIWILLGPLEQQNG